MEMIKEERGLGYPSFHKDFGRKRKQTYQSAMMGGIYMFLFLFYLSRSMDFSMPTPKNLNFKS